LRHKPSGLVGWFPWNVEIHLSLTLPPQNVSLSQLF
jgi:hypothetical protein